MDTVEQLIERHLEFKSANEGASPATVRKYRQSLHALVLYCRQVARCDPMRPDQDVLQVYTGPYLHKQGLSASGRKPVIAAIRGFYAWAQWARLVEANYGAFLIQPKVPKSLPHAMSLNAAEKLIWAPDLNTFQGIRDAAMIAMLMGCGLRIAGLVDLNESSLQFETIEGREQLTLRVTEKGGKERLVPAPDAARLLVRAYLGHPELERIDRKLPDSDLVLFVNLRNTTVGPHDHRGEKRRMSDWAVRDMIKAYCNKVGVPVAMAHPHALRHLYGTELAESGVPDAMRQMLMGHSDPNSTAIYTHLAIRNARQASDTANPLTKIRTPVSDLLKRLG